MEAYLLLYKSSSISYYRFGNGINPVCCFHGYGENALNFKFLNQLPDPIYSFYCVDLPFHGKTEWKETEPFDVVALAAIASEIMRLHYPSRAPFKFDLIGFSLGGRMALGLYQQCPELVSKLILLAPDGLRVNPWYWFATQTSIGMGLFSFTMKHPGWFFGLLNLLNKLHLVNPSVFKFVGYYIGNATARKILFDRWIGLRKIKPSLPKIKRLIKNNHTTAKLIYGRHDRIILSSRGEDFRKGIETYCEVKVIEAGHQVLHEKNLDQILTALRD